jgi:nicotinic acid mononucleotide adenylyltransferase
MKTYKQFLNEVKQTDTLVLTFGRMNPPTSGHAVLVDKVISVAKTESSKYEVWLSATQDAKKNPLMPDRKVFWAKKMFNDNNIHSATPTIRTPIELLKSKSGKYQNIVFVVGSDRVSDFQKLFDQYNGKDYSFDSIRVISAGERDPDSDSASGMSATKLRSFALHNDIKNFKSGLVNVSDSEAAELMREVRVGLKVKNESESLSNVSGVRNSFYLNETFRVGQFVSDGSGVYEILDRGANHVMLANNHGEISKAFVDSLTILEDANIPQQDSVGDLTFKGYKPSNIFQSNEQAVAAFGDTIRRYEDGHIKDAVAILKALRAVDSFLQITHQVIVDQDHPDDKAINTKMLQLFDTAKLSLSRIGEFMHHVDYMDTLKDMVGVAEVNPPDDVSESVIKSSDKLKVATIIADTLGCDCSGSNPESIVNMALRTAKKNSTMVRGESLKIIQRMLELAAEVGIKYDENIIAGIAKKDVVESFNDKIKNIVKKSTPIKESTTKQFGELLEGAKVSVTHESGKVTYGKIKGKHGSVIEVSHRNGKVGFYHSYKVNEVSELPESEDSKTYSDLKCDDKHPELKNVNTDPASYEKHTAVGHGMSASNHSHRKMKVNYMKGE